MSPKKIEVGKTYRNKGKGTTHRKVIAIGNEHRPEQWFTDRPRPKEPGVLFEQINAGGFYQGFYRLYLSSFAAWCGGEV